MADPGTLIPSDAAASNTQHEDSHLSCYMLSEDMVSPHLASSSMGVPSSFQGHSVLGSLDKRSRLAETNSAGNECNNAGESMSSENFVPPNTIEEELPKSPEDFIKPYDVQKHLMYEIPGRPGYPYSHARSPSWTEGVSSPAVRRMKVKDVSQYMIDAAKENPQLAQKLHDVFLESGVVAPPDLFTEIYSEQLNVLPTETKSPAEDKEIKHMKGQDNLNQARFLPSLPHHGLRSKGCPREQTENQVSPQIEVPPLRYGKNVPVAAAAAAAAAVVASSMVAAVAKTSTDAKLELPVAAAATATAAAVVATRAAVSKQYENLETLSHSPDSPAAYFNPFGFARIDEDTDAIAHEQQGSGNRDHQAFGTNSEGERTSDRSIGNDSTKSDVMLEEVADCEIPWEDITLGERIGLGTNLDILYSCIYVSFMTSLRVLIMCHCFHSCRILW